LEISQKQNLPFGYSITINYETLRKTLKNIEEKCLEDLSGFLSLQIPDFAWPQIPNPVEGFQLSLFFFSKTLTSETKKNFKFIFLLVKTLN